jgi:hypothetical protein
LRRHRRLVVACGSVRRNTRVEGSDSSFFDHRMISCSAMRTLIFR